MPSKCPRALLSFKYLIPDSPEASNIQPSSLPNPGTGNYKMNRLLTTKGVGVMSENRYTGTPWVMNVVAASRANLQMPCDGGDRRAEVSGPRVTTERKEVTALPGHLFRFSTAGTRLLCGHWYRTMKLGKPSQSPDSTPCFTEIGLKPREAT